MALNFDADALSAAIDRPRVTIKGREYVGVPLSLVQMERIGAAASALKGPDGVIAPAAMERFARTVFDTVWPRPWWKVWRVPVSWKLLAEPPEVWLGILAGFSAALTMRAASAPTDSPNAAGGASA